MTSLGTYGKTSDTWAPILSNSGGKVLVTGCCMCLLDSSAYLFSYSAYWSQKEVDSIISNNNNNNKLHLLWTNFILFWVPWFSHLSFGISYVNIENYQL